MATLSPQVRFGTLLAEELHPAPDPWHVARQLANQPNLLFLDSALRSASLGRYSFVAADPFAWMDSRGTLVSEGWPGCISLTYEADPFAVLTDWLSRYRQDTVPGLPPFQGGAAGLFGYELGQHLERIPRAAIDDFEIPELALGFYDWVVAFDHVADRAWILSTGWPEQEPEARQRRARSRLKRVRQLLDRPLPPVPGPMSWHAVPATLHPLPDHPRVSSCFTPSQFQEAIRAAIEYVHAGDCFQVNLAQRLLTPWREPPLSLYQRLRERNPAPFAGYFEMGAVSIVSASPERFLRLRQGEVETRPIKGTRPRGKTADEDADRARELLGSEKDRAENVMIVDLLRNDLGRVCRFGSVQVEAVCRLESYPTVHHLVSDVRGTLRPGLGAIDLLRAAFPGGSITGAPKVRAMEIIAELEPVVRGPYCGSLGYLSFDGAMDTSILIRTFTTAGGWAQFPVGGGIVADSRPEIEYAETLHKAAGLLRSLA
ncbi:MAG: aminodeoxychorismate synthase component I [Gemmataceae bacterium]